MSFRGTWGGDAGDFAPIARLVAKNHPNNPRCTRFRKLTMIRNMLKICKFVGKSVIVLNVQKKKLTFCLSGPHATDTSVCVKKGPELRQLDKAILEMDRGLLLLRKKKRIGIHLRPVTVNE
jgi:hypothetical protein